MILNYFEESLIGLSKLPAEWRSQASLDELATFLQLNWEQRSVFYDDGQVTSSQQFLEMKGARGIRTNNYIGTIVFKGQQLNIFPKVFRTDSGDNERDELDLHHLMKNLVRWIEYCGKMDCGDYFRLLIFFQGTTKTKNVTILAKPMTPQTLTTAMRQGSHLTGAASLTRSGFWTSQNAIVIDSDASPL